MMDKNETLQTSLAEIERGVPLEVVLNALPAEAAELVPLIRLAASTRSVPHPVMRPEIVRAQQIRVVNATYAARTTRAGSLRAAAWNWLAAPRNSMALAGAFALVLVVIAAAVGINLLLNTGQVAKLADVTGLVEVENSAESNDWHFVSAGEPLQAGQSIRTYAEFNSNPGLL